jgi:hypothetical protein
MHPIFMGSIVKDGYVRSIAKEILSKHSDVYLQRIKKDEGKDLLKYYRCDRWKSNNKTRPPIKQW